MELKEYIANKIKVLRKHFKIKKISTSEMRNMFANCTNEIQVDRVAHTIIMKYL